MTFRPHALAFCVDLGPQWATLYIQQWNAASKLIVSFILICCIHTIWCTHKGFYTTHNQKSQHYIVYDIVHKTTMQKFSHILVQVKGEGDLIITTASVLPKIMVKQWYSWSSEFEQNHKAQLLQTVHDVMMQIIMQTQLVLVLYLTIKNRFFFS